MPLDSLGHVSNLRGKLEKFKAMGNNTKKNGFCYEKYLEGKKQNEIAGKVVNVCGVCYSHASMDSYMKNLPLSLDKNEIRSSIGIGLDWFSPIGPMNFSLAQPVTKAKSDKTESFRFNLGTTF